MPRIVLIQNTIHPLASPARVKYCTSFLCRLRGLTFRPPLSPDEGLLLVFRGDSRVDSSIHMLGVGFDLAVFWINSQMKVVDKVLAKAWRPAYLSKAPARYVLEIHAGRLDDYDIGDTVQFENA